MVKKNFHVTARIPEKLFKPMMEIIDEMGITRSAFISTSIYNLLNSDFVSQVKKKIKKEKSGK